MFFSKPASLLWLYVVMLVSFPNQLQTVALWCGGQPLKCSLSSYPTLRSSGGSCAHERLLKIQPQQPKAGGYQISPARRCRWVCSVQWDYAGYITLGT